MALKAIDTVFHSQIMPNKEQCIAFLWDIQENRIHIQQGAKGKILILTTNLFLKVIFTYLLMQILIPNPNTFQNSKIISRKKHITKHVLQITLI